MIVSVRTTPSKGIAPANMGFRKVSTTGAFDAAGVTTRLFDVADLVAQLVESESKKAA